MTAIFYGPPVTKKVTVKNHVAVAADIVIIIIIIITYLPKSSTHKQQVQRYNSGRTTRQQTALTVALKYGVKRKL